MSNASKDSRITLYYLAILGVAAWLYTSQQMCRLSSWIVTHDHVWEEMDRTGHGEEHYAAEAFHQFHYFGGVIIQSIASIVFLALLWRHLFPPTPSAPQATSPVDQHPATPGPK